VERARGKVLEATGKKNAQPNPAWSGNTRQEGALRKRSPGSKAR